MRSEDLPSQRGGIVPFLHFPETIFATSFNNNFVFCPTKTFVPCSNVTGLSVFSLTVKQGTSRNGVSAPFHDIHYPLCNY